MLVERNGWKVDNLVVGNLQVAEDFLVENGSLGWHATNVGRGIRNIQWFSITLSKRNLF